MKFSSAAIVAALAATAHGFSVSMSSIGYLNNLGGSAGVASTPPARYAPFNTSFKSSPAPSPMAAPAAPAPAPVSSYTSGLANAPANSDLNYLKTLGGGSAMKSGRNYSGVSQSFKATPSSSPMASQASPAPAPASSYTSGLASAPANSDLNYLKSIGGGSAMKSGRNYSGVSQSFRPVRPSIPSHTESLSGKTMAQSYASPAPAPVTAVAPSPAPASSYTSGLASAPANSDLNYLKSIGGGSAMKSGRNYSGVNQSFRPVRPSIPSHTESLAGKTMAPPAYGSAPQSYAAPAPAPVAAAAPTPTPANGSYMSGAPMSSSYSSMHNSMAIATKNYSGVNPRPQAARSAFGSYLEAL